MVAAGLNKYHVNTPQDIENFTNSALCCIRDLFQAIEQSEFEGVPEGETIQIRVGIHTGPINAVSSSKYYYWFQ